MKLISLGRNSALKIRKEIITNLTNQGYKLNINVPYLKDMAKLEK